MLDDFKHIEPSKINDIAALQKLLKTFMNAYESMFSLLSSHQKEIQELRDEINRLKGEHGDFPPREKEEDTESSDEDEDKSDEVEKDKPKRKNKNTKKGAKKPKIEIDEVVTIEMDKSVLPLDAVFKGYREVVQQEIILKRHNKLFRIPIYYSASERKTYSGELPVGEGGEFGGQLKSWLQLLHHYTDVTQGRLAALMETLGLYISSGTISNILLSNTDLMVQEARDILRAGLEKIDYAQMDGTKGVQAGVGKSTQIISTPWYSLSYTMSSKSKADIIWALQGKPGDSVPLIYNALAKEFLADSTVPKKDQRLLSELLVFDQNYSLIELDAILTQQAPHLLTKGTYPKMISALALAYYFTQSDFPTLNCLVSDAGPEYTGIANHQALCWLHEERHYKKMTPILKVHQDALKHFRGQIWEFYKKLLDFKEHPPDQQQAEKQALKKEFDTIFTQQTDYFDLNDRIEKTFAKKDKLLQVLDFPNLPLHNNGAELAVRRKVRKRDISMHTISDKGTQAQDAFMSVVETAAKLGINAFDYLYDRITKQFKRTSLAELIGSATI